MTTMAAVTTAIADNRVTVAGCRVSGCRFGFTTLTNLVFIRGLITCLNPMPIPHLNSAFSVTYKMLAKEARNSRGL